MKKIDWEKENRVRDVQAQVLGIDRAELDRNLLAQKRYEEKRARRR